MSTTMTVKRADQCMTQRMSALGKANEVRLYRAGLKRALRCGLRCLDDVLDVREIDPLLRTMCVGELLLALPAVGPTKVTKMLRKIDASQSRRLEDLTERQRTELCALVPVNRARTSPPRLTLV